MGWRGYESEIDLGMLFRKMYCHKCGTRLKRKKITAIYHKGAPEYDNYVAGIHTLGMSEKAVSHYVYQCPKCNSEITYDDQCLISKRQRQQKKRILNDD